MHSSCEHLIGFNRQSGVSFPGPPSNGNIHLAALTCGHSCDKERCEPRKVWYRANVISKKSKSGSDPKNSYTFRNVFCKKRTVEVSEGSMKGIRHSSWRQVLRWEGAVQCQQLPRRTLWRSHRLEDMHRLSWPVMFWQTRKAGSPIHWSTEALVPYAIHWHGASLSYTLSQRIYLRILFIGPSTEWVRFRNNSHGTLSTGWTTPLSARHLAKTLLTRNWAEVPHHLLPAHGTPGS